MFNYHFSFVLYFIIFTIGICDFHQTHGNGDVTTDSNIFNLPVGHSEKTRTFYDYKTHIIAYKDLSKSRCYLERMHDDFSRSQIKRTFPNDRDTLYISDVPLTKHQIWRLAGSRLFEFCRGYPTYLLQDTKPSSTIEDINDLEDESRSISITKQRAKRQTTAYFRGRLNRGQTQSQYLNFGGNGQNTGKAEAESSLEGSRAVVTGNSGMGQAQSQSGSSGSCDECYGGYDSQSQTLGYGTGRYGKPGQITTGAGRPGVGIPGRTAVVPGGPQGPDGTIGLRPGERQPGGGYLPSGTTGEYIPGQPAGSGGYLPAQLGPGRPGEYIPSQLRPGTPGGYLPGQVAPGYISGAPSDAQIAGQTSPGQIQLPGQIPGQFLGSQRPGEHIGDGQIPERYPGQIPGSHYPASQIPREQVPGGYYPGQITDGQIPGRFPGSQISEHYPQEPGGQITSGTAGGTSHIPGVQIPGSQIPGSQIPGSYPGAQIPGSYRPQITGGQFPGAGYPGQQSEQIGKQPPSFQTTDQTGRVHGVGTGDGGYGTRAPYGPDGRLPAYPGKITAETLITIHGPGGTSDAYGQYPDHLPGAQIPGQRPGDGTVAYPGSQVPRDLLPGQYPGAQISQYPEGRVPGAQLPSAQTPGQHPESQIPGGHKPGQFPGRINGQYPTRQIIDQYPGGQIPGQYPGSQTSGQYPGGQIPGQLPAGKMPVQYPGAYIPGGPIPGQHPSGQIPTQYPSGQVPGHQYPGGQIPGQYPDGQLPGRQYLNGQVPGGQIPGHQYPDGQVPGQYPSGQIPAHQYPNGQVPGHQYPGGQIPGQYPSGQVPGHQYPSGQVPGHQYPGAQIPGQYPDRQVSGQYPSGQIPGRQYPGGQVPGHQSQDGQVPGQYPGGQIPGQYPGGLVPGQVPSTHLTGGTGQYPGQYPGGQVPGLIAGQFDGRYPSSQINSQYPGSPIGNQYPGRPGDLASAQIDPRIPCAPGQQCPGGDDSSSQAQSSVQQVDNDTQASASAQGQYLGGTAQSQVSGTYSGGGSFSAQAGSIDGKRGAQTQVSGGAQGATSSAQGNGGLGQSQSQVQYSSETGGTISNSQTSGFSHGTNTQVQAGDKGGMADAQANGPGSTSSQAQIGFSPHEESEADKQNSPFRGGGTASAQSGSYTGQSQAQIQGKFRYGIRYTGAAQAGSGNKESLGELRKNSTIAPILLDQLKNNFSQSTQMKNFAVESQKTAPHIDSHIKVHDPMASSTTFKPPQAMADKEDNTDDYYYDNDDDDETTEKDDIPMSRTISQSTKSQKQHILLGPLEDLDAQIIQAKGDRDLPDGTILQPGQTIPGTPGYQIPQGYRGRVTSLAHGDKTIAYGKDSQAQSVTITPGTGKINYIKPGFSQKTYIPYSYYRSAQQPNIRSGGTSITYPKFLTVTKSESGSKNPITGKKNPQVYYTQSSTCGFFTNTCVFSGAKKICLPRAKSNPDGTPMLC